MSRNHTETQDQRIVELAASGVSEDDGDVVVWVDVSEEPYVARRGLRLTEDDALALADELREAARLVTGSEPQTFIRLLLLNAP